MQNRKFPLGAGDEIVSLGGGVKSFIRRFDWWLIAAAFVLIMLGTMTILSTILTPQTSVFKDSMFVAQLFNVGLGALIFLITAAVDYRIYRHFVWIGYAVMLMLLILVLGMGFASHGAVRWIDLGFFRFQPSEISKILYILTMAAFFSQIKQDIARLKYVLLSGVLMIVPTVLVMLEPDLGTGLVFIAVWLGMLIASSSRLSHLILIAVGSLAVLPVAWFFVLAPYQKDRIHVFLDPKIDPLGRGYAVIQSIIAVGSGKLFGRGWGRGTQSHLQFLPERQTDFIFATLAEELGFFGVFILLIAFLLLLYRIIRNAQYSSDMFGSYLCLGVFMVFIFHAIVNIGMNIGVMPITGIPLPFVSYGGSALIANLIALGIVESVARHRNATTSFHEITEKE